MRAPLLIVVAMILAGCGFQNPDEGFQVLPGFSSAERAEMEAICSELCERTDGRYCPVLLDEDWVNTIEVSRDLRSKSDPNERVYGRTDFHRDHVSAHTDILMQTGMDARKFSVTFHHEIGHAGGCRRDMINTGNIMSHGYINQPDTWTETDLDCIDNDYDNSQAEFDVK